MSLDLYSGSLSKFYAREFETAQARAAKEMGMEYNLVFSPDGFQPLPIAEAKNVAETLMSELLASDSPVNSPWNEDVSDYFSDQLNYECRNALLFVAARLSNQNLSLPKKLKDLPDFSEFDVGLSEEEYLSGPCGTLECHLFFPSKGLALFAGNHPQGEFVGTTLGVLEMQLGYLAEQIWNNDIMVTEWGQRGPADTGTPFIMKRGFLPWKKKLVPLPKEDNNIDDEVMHSAEYAFSIFAQALAFAKKNNVPICIDA